MSYSHLTNKNEQNKKDIYAKSIELEADVQREIYYQINYTTSKVLQMLGVDLVS
jgi:hypothetical protein